MKKELKTTIYITIAIATFIVAYVICFRAWADKEVFVHRACFRQYTGTATLIDKGAYGAGCHWKPHDQRDIDERWNTCDNYNVGDVNYNYPEASFDCK